MKNIGIFCSNFSILKISSLETTLARLINKISRDAEVWKYKNQSTYLLKKKKILKCPRQISAKHLISICPSCDCYRIKIPIGSFNKSR